MGLCLDLTILVKPQVQSVDLQKPHLHVRNQTFPSHQQPKQKVPHTQHPEELASPTAARDASVFDTVTSKVMRKEASSLTYQVKAAADALAASVGLEDGNSAPTSVTQGQSKKVPVTLWCHSYD